MLGCKIAHGSNNFFGVEGDDIAIKVGNIYTIMYMWFDICSKHVTLLKVWLLNAHCKV